MRASESSRSLSSHARNMEGIKSMSPSEVQAATVAICNELKQVFGPAPILSTESMEAFDAILLGLIESHKPWDFMSKQLVWWMTLATWDIWRYGRHKVLGIERHHRQHLEFVAQRAKAALKSKDDRAYQSTDPELSAEVNRLFDLLDTCDSTVTDIKDLIERSTTELDHARALEKGINFHEKLDEHVNSAMRRFHISFAQMQQYREICAWQIRRGEEVVEVEPPKALEQVSIVPVEEGSKQ